MIDVLTSFRFIAAFFVFLHHTGNPGYGFGERGVTYFFILSGFILSYKYYEKFYTGLHKKSVLSFFSARIARIYPVHLLTFLLALLLGFFAPDYFSRKYTAANLLLVQWLFPRNIFTYNPASWSLSVEMIFYTLFPVLVFLFSKLVLKGRPISEVRFRTLFLLLPAVYLLQSLVVAVVRDTNAPHATIKWWLLYVSPFRVSDFSIGVILSLIYLKCKKEKSFVNHFRLYSRQTVLFTFLEAGALFLVYLSFYKPIYPFQAAMFAVNYVPSLAAVVLVFSFQNGLISALLRQKPFIFLGEISFSFFMLHYFVIAFFRGILKYPEGSHTLAVFCLSVVLSACTYKFYELPVRDALRKIFSACIDRLASNRGSAPAKTTVKEEYRV